MTAKQALKRNNDSVGLGYITKLNCFIFTMLLALILCSAFFVESSIVWTEIFETSVFLLTTLWLVASYLGKSWLLEEHRLLIPLLFLAIYAFIQAIRIGPVVEIEGIRIRQAISNSPNETWLTAQKFLSFTLFAGLLLHHVNNLQRLQLTVYVIIGVALLSAFFGLLKRTEALMAEQATFDGFGQFANRNHFALLMEMSLGVTLGLLLEGNLWRVRKLAYLAIAFVLWMALILTYSRGAIISGLCQMVFVAVLFFTVKPVKSFEKHNNRATLFEHLKRSLVLKVSLIVSLLVTAGLSVIWIGGDTVLYRLRSVPKEFDISKTRAGESRLEIWRSTLNLIKANPIVGVGFGGYGTSITAYHQASGRWTPQEAHNEYLELLASGGIIGGVIGILGIASVIRFAITQLRKRDSVSQAICIGAMASLFAVILHSLVDFGLHITVNAVVCLSLIVLACANVSSERE
jgi:O-antigen ligase